MAEPENNTQAQGNTQPAEGPDTATSSALQPLADTTQTPQASSAEWRPTVTAKPQDVESQQEKPANFFTKPYFSALLFDNQFSEARDLDAAERNFLSWVRLSMVLAVSGTAIMINLRFHDESSSNVGAMSQNIPDAPVVSTLAELEAMLSIKPAAEYSKPLGVIFYVLAILSLFVAFSTYISACSGYIKQHIVVTNSLSAISLVAVIALTIIASNIVLLKENSLHLLSGS